MKSFLLYGVLVAGLFAMVASEDPEEINAGDEMIDALANMTSPLSAGNRNESSEDSVTSQPADEGSGDVTEAVTISQNVTEAENPQNVTEPEAAPDNVTETTSAYSNASESEGEALEGNGGFFVVPSVFITVCVVAVPGLFF